MNVFTLKSSARDTTILKKMFLPYYIADLGDCINWRFVLENSHIHNLTTMRSHCLKFMLLSALHVNHVIVVLL